jgi:hypothetical protein
MRLGHLFEGHRPAVAAHDTGETLCILGIRAQPVQIFWPYAAARTGHAAAYEVQVDAPTIGILAARGVGAPVPKSQEHSDATGAEGFF